MVIIKPRVFLSLGMTDGRRHNEADIAPGLRTLQALYSIKEAYK